MSEKKEIQLNIEEMRKNKVFLATPMYGGMCHGLYTKSLMDTTAVTMQHGLQLQIYYMFNESLITRARNYCAANFMKSDADWLFFVDSEKVLHAAKSGMYDETPHLLEKVAGDMVFNPLPDEYPDGQAPIFEPVKIKEGATGFMLIHRSVFEKYNEEHPERLYTPDHLREGEFAEGEQIMAYFDCIINEQNRYLSEDYMFSEVCRDMGIDIWALPMVELMHCGSHIFQGKLIDMAVAGVHATLDPNDVEKMRRKQGADGELTTAPNPGTISSNEAEKNSS